MIQVVSNMYQKLIQHVSKVVFHLFDFPWYAFFNPMVQMYHSLFDHSSIEGHFGCSSLVAMQIKSLCTVIYEFCVDMFSFLWDKCPEVPLLCCVVSVCLVFKETAKLLSGQVIKILHFCQHYMKDEVSRYPHQHLALSMFKKFWSF